MSLVSGPGLGGANKSSTEKLAIAKHVEYIISLDKRTDEYEYWLTEHLRLNGVYWGLTALHVLKHPDALPRDELVTFTISCWNETTGGFGAAPGHDAHMLYTCSAVQILAMTNGLDALEKPLPWDSQTTYKERLGEFIASLQDRKTGVFHGDEFGEPDTRFLYAALNALSLLGLLHLVDVPLAVSFIDACQNLDAGYGTVPGAETHSGQIFVCLAALSIAGVLEDRLRTDAAWADRLAAWLAERQVSSAGSGLGGLNGRPEKKEDVCYSWWVLAPLAMLKRMHWIDRPALRKFILGCQDGEHGGLADRPGDAVDVYHTCFGMTGLTLLEWDERRTGEGDEGFGLEEIDPVYCMPRRIITQLVKR